MKLPWQTTYAPAVAFAVLALFGGLGIKGSADASAEKLYESQIASCHRGNSLREESNRRIHSHEADKNALRSFLVAAAEARQAAFDRDGNESDKKAADEYRKLVHQLDTQVKFEPVKLVNCKEVIKKP